MTTVSTLINKLDNCEIIRDQIAIILANNVAAQMALATAQAKDPELWNFEVYTERNIPYEKFLNDEAETTPFVNVWFDNESFDKSAGNVVKRQKADAVFNVDCMGFGVSADNPTGGHELGDKKAATESQRLVKLVRNILMASCNTYLGLRGTVWGRWIRNITMYQPQIDGRTLQNVVGGRVAFEVAFNELSPQETGPNLEVIFIDVKRSTDGAVLAQAQYCPTTEG